MSDGLRPGELLHPGLGEEDPLKRIPQRLPGNFFEAFSLYFGLPASRPIVYAHPTSDVSTGWTNVYTGSGGVVVGGAHYPAVRTDDGFTLYTATGLPGTGTSEQDVFVTDDVHEAGYDFFIEYTAAALFQPPNAGTFVFDFRPIGTGIYSTGTLNLGTGSPYQLTQDAFTRFLVPLHLNGTEAPRAQATLTCGVGVPPANPAYIALTHARVICRPH